MAVKFVIAIFLTIVIYATDGYPSNGRLHHVCPYGVADVCGRNTVKCADGTSCITKFPYRGIAVCCKPKPLSDEVCEDAGYRGVCGGVRNQECVEGTVCTGQTSLPKSMGLCCNVH